MTILASAGTDGLSSGRRRELLERLEQGFYQSVEVRDRIACRVLAEPDFRAEGDAVRCLVVDDSATMRRLIREALHGTGRFEVIEAANGAEALPLCDGSIDLVITDWAMPLMGGLDLVKSLRADPRHARTPILLVTTRSAQADIVEAIEAGVSSYVLKPFTPRTLKAKIDQILSLAAGALAR